jgi:polysaccharide export outer membrane protein
MIFPSPFRRRLRACSRLLLLFSLSSRAIWSQEASAVPPIPATSQQTNARIEELARAAEHHPLDPTIGAGDLIHIDVFDVPDLSHDVRVNASGDMTLALVPGLIHVGGLTPFQAQDQIGDMLAENGIVTHPHVSVIVKEQNSHSISVVGAVQQPGIFQVVRPMTVLEALARAGGLDKDAGSDVLITRHVTATNAPQAGAPSAGAANSSAAAPPDQTITVHLQTLLDTGDQAYNVPIYAGDILTVPRAGIVYVAGAVLLAGGYTLPNSQSQMSILKALALSRGVTTTSKPDQSVIFRKRPDGTTQQIDVHLNKIMERKEPDQPLYANDVLFVPDSTAKRAFYKAGAAALSITSGVLVYRGTQ